MKYFDLSFVVASSSLFTLSMALFIMLLTVPGHQYTKRLKACKVYLAIVMLLVSLSVAKSVIFGLPVDMKLNKVSTVITAMFHAWLFTVIGVTFVNPKALKKKWVIANVLTILVFSAIALTGLLFVPEYFNVFLTVAMLGTIALYITYQVKFYTQYNKSIKKIDEAVDEHIGEHLRWIKVVYIVATVVGVTALISPFTNIQIHSTWLLFMAGAYIYITVGFIKYGMMNLAAVVKKVSAGELVEQSELIADEPEQEVAEEAANKAPETAESRQQEMDADAAFEQKLREWIDQRGCMQEGVVSADLARQFGVSLTFFRAYFKTHMNTDFRQWRQQKRIERACEIIRNNPDYSYDVIAEMVGIGDRSNFNKAFTKIMGMTPKEYGQKCESK